MADPMQEWNQKFKTACITNDLRTVTYMLFHSDVVPATIPCAENNVIVSYMIDCLIQSRPCREGRSSHGWHTINSAVKYSSIEFMLMAESWLIYTPRFYINRLCMMGNLHIVKMYLSLHNIAILVYPYRLLYDTTMAGHMFIVSWFHRMNLFIGFGLFNEVFEAACEKNNVKQATYAMHHYPITQCNKAYKHACYHNSVALVTLIFSHWIPNWNNKSWIKFMNESDIDARIIYLAVTRGFKKLSIRTTAKLMDLNMNFKHYHKRHIAKRHNKMRQCVYNAISSFNIYLMDIKNTIPIIESYMSHVDSINT